MVYSKVVCTLCRMDNNIGLYANGVVYEPKMVTKMADLIKKDELPLPILVWIGIARDEKEFSAWTAGMKRFGFDEMEILNSEMDATNLTKR